MTLVDIAPKMLEVSRQLNPECTHIQGDMRTIKLGQTFDSVFIHDAIMYMADRESLIQALGTARLHCHPEGHILVIPSAFKSNFTTATFNGAHDTPTTSIRYMEWRHDPDPKDCTFDVDFSFMILEKGKPMEVVYDHHIFGLFTKEEWLEAGQEVGLDCDIISLGYGKLPSSYGQVLLYRHKPE